jgi:hypothetical protein
MWKARHGAARQVAALARAGSELVHIAVDRDEAAAAVPRIKERLSKMGVTTLCVYRKLNSAIMVVKAAEDRLRCDGADALNCAMKRGVLVQRSMSPQLIIIDGICAEDGAQARFTERDHVVQAFPADRANESLNVSILSG